MLLAKQSGGSLDATRDLIATIWGACWWDRTAARSAQRSSKI
jgi:hypothetical protein